MRWNLGWFICVLLAGPCAYLLLDMLQPNRMAVFAVIFGLPLLWWLGRIGVFLFKSLSP